MTFMKTTAAAICLILTLCACAQRQDWTSKKWVSIPTDLKIEQCPSVQVSDQRKDKTWLVDAPKTLKMESGTQWLINALIFLPETHRIVVEGDGHESGNGVRLNILGAYISSKATSMLATVSLRAEFPDSTTRTYRGSDVVVNVAGGENEMTSTLDAALLQALTHFRGDYFAYCRKPTRASEPPAIAN